jgi:hypothetical protein
MKTQTRRIHPPPTRILADRSQPPEWKNRKRGRRLAAVSSALLLLAAGAPARAAGSVDDLTGPWQLLVDDLLVAARTNVTRGYHAFQKYAGNPVVVPTTAWEQLLNIYGTVLPNETRTGYRMWYQNYLTNDPCANTSWPLYALSVNGLNWTKPALYQSEWCGTSNNNRFFPGFMTSVMHTPDDPDPARRYKFMTFAGGGWSAAWSPDGVSNVVSAANNPVAGGSDSGQFCYDPRTRQYLGYVKVGWTDTNGLARRAVGYMATDNFTNWPAPALCLHPDAVDDRWSTNIIQRTHFYGLSAFPYETMYLGFLWIHRATNLVANPPQYAGYQVGPIYMELVSSRDGVNWTREEGDRPALLALGAVGSWDGGMVFTARAPLVEGDTVKLWYGGFKNVHDTALKLQRGSIGYATLRKDGFASLDAGATPGTILTKTFGNTGGPLLVNYHTNAPGGFLKVEVTDENNNVLPGYGQADCVPLTGNSVTQAVTWAAHTELPAGRPWLRLRFLLQNASLYSFMAGSNAALAEVPPTLAYAWQNSDLVLSWPTNAPGFMLEYATNLSPATWQSNAAPPVLIGDRNVVTNPVTGAARYFRLRKP